MYDNNIVMIIIDISSSTLFIESGLYENGKMFISSIESIFLRNQLLRMVDFILVDSTTVRENVISP